MGRPKSLKPQYCLDRNDGRAYVRIDGKRLWLGKHNSQESRDRYDRLIGEWIASGRMLRAASAGVSAEGDGLTVGSVIAAFWSHAEQTYPHPPCKPKQRPKGELGNFWDALRPLRRLYGETPARDFGPLALRAVRDEMIRVGWCLNHVNRNVARLKHVFKWATQNELLPGEVHWRLSSVIGLRLGTPRVRATKAVPPVAESAVLAVLPHLPPPVRAMVQVHLLAGMRSGEVCSMRPADIDRTDPRLWIYRPVQHKNAHRGHDRPIALGPLAQAVIRPFIGTDPTDYLFRPAEGRAWRAERQRAKRKTPWTPSQVRRAAEARAGRSTSSLRPCYDKNTYAMAIRRACDRAFPPPPGLDAEAVTAWRAAHRWHPHQLRHAYATKVLKEEGPGMVGTMLGDRSPRMVAIYAEQDLERARQIATRIG